MAAQALPLQPRPAERTSRKPDAHIDKHDGAALRACRCRFQRHAVVTLHTTATGHDRPSQAPDQRRPAFAAAGTGDGDHLGAVAVGILHPLGEMRPGVGNDPQ